MGGDDDEVPYQSEWRVECGLAAMKNDVACSLSTTRPFPVAHFTARLIHQPPTRFSSLAPLHLRTTLLHGFHRGIDPSYSSSPSFLPPPHRLAHSFLPPLTPLSPPVLSSDTLVRATRSTYPHTSPGCTLLSLLRGSKRCGTGKP